MSNADFHVLISIIHLGLRHFQDHPLISVNQLTHLLLRACSQIGGLNIYLKKTRSFRSCAAVNDFWVLPLFVLYFFNFARAPDGAEQRLCIHQIADTWKPFLLADLRKLMQTQNASQCVRML